MADNIVQIEVEFEDGKKGFAYLKSQSKKTGEEAGGDFASSFVGGFLPGLKAAFKVATGVGAVLGAIFSKEAVEAAIDQENAINNFNNALSRSGQFSKAFSQDFQEYVGTLQASTKFADEAILSSAALLQTIGRLSQSQLKPATQAALDLASAYKINLEQAFETVGKAANGQIGALGRLGIEVQKGKTDAETFANALALIQSRAGGAAASEINTFAGAVANAKNAFGEILEAVGNFIVQSPAVIGIIKGIGQVFNNIALAIAGNSSINDFITNAAKSLISFAGGVNDYLVRPIVYFGNIANGVFQAIVGGLTVIAQAFSVVGFGVNKILNSVGVVGDDVVSAAKDQMDNLTNAVVAQADKTKAAFDAAGDSTFGDSIAEQINVVDFALQKSLATQNSKNLADGLALQQTRELNVEYQTLYQGLLNIGFATDDLAGKTTLQLKAMADAATQVAQTFKSALVSGISNGIQTMVKSLASGKFSFDQFGKMLLGIIGNMAIQIGTTLLSIGIGIDALKTSLLTFTGGPAIAAGIALIAIGALLSSLSAGGGETANVQPGGGVVDSGGGVAAVASTSPETEQRRAPGTEVVVNVQGNIFNGREQAQMIAENLQEYFDTNNGLLVST